ncbi:MAG: hypothetical protein AAF202_10420, partial [Pseudomonadota bacterium]
MNYQFVQEITETNLMGGSGTFLKAVILFSFVLTAGCSRDLEEASKLSFGEPTPPASLSSSKLSVDNQIERAIIILRRGKLADETPGPVIERFHFSARCGDDCFKPSPFPVAMQVDPGNVTVQVLIGWQRLDNKKLVITYGESETEVVPGEQSVDIGLDTFGDPTGILQADIVGQYVDRVVSSQGFGPTGVADLAFFPPTGSPPIVVESRGLFNGWFTTSGLEGAPFQLVHRETKNILMPNLSPSNLISSASSQSMYIQAPSVAFEKPDPGPTPRPVENLFDAAAVFIGPEAGNLGANVCYDTVTDGTSLNSAEIFEDAAGMSPIRWSPSTANPLHISRLAGAASTCGSQTPFVTELEFDPDRIRKDLLTAFGIEGPFAMSTHSFSDCGVVEAPIASCYSNNRVNIKWHYIPNANTALG